MSAFSHLISSRVGQTHGTQYMYADWISKWSYNSACLYQSSSFKSFKDSLLFNKVHIFTMIFKYLNLPLSRMFPFMYRTLQSIPWLPTSQICSEPPDPGAPLVLFAFSSMAFPVLWPSKPLSSSQIPSWLLHEIFPDLSLISPPEVMYSFSKSMCNSVLVWSVTGFYRDVYMSCLPIIWQAFWGQKPPCIQFCDVHCLM